MNLFTYGSLVFAEVMRAVTGRSFAHEPARLPGWTRVCIRGTRFPGVRARASASTSGVLWRGLDPRSVARLDRFETHHYERRTLTVRTSAGENVSAEVYVIAEAHLGALSQEPWRPDRFARESLAALLKALQQAERRPP
ncbi:MAG TPA: gamma-glutamylcyclotransferase family protein [Myxococcota bacterium]|nr:gamma-glutamylcyclotransferase family protein [Myxococcota bacterium]